MFGGTIVGNKINLTPSRENCAFQLLGNRVDTARHQGHRTFLTFFAGVFAFDSLIENCHAYNLALPIDISSMENVTFSKCFFNATTDQLPTMRQQQTLSIATTIRSRLPMAPTSPTKMARIETLRFTEHQRVEVQGLRVQRFYNGIFIDSCQGALISKCVVRGAQRPVNTSNSIGIALTQGAECGLPLGILRPTW